MAIYHASTSSVSRGAGHSSCAKSAYIGGVEITNEITGEVHNYKNRNGVEHNEIILPSEIEKEITAQELWNKAEKIENRKDARVGREWNIALPHELNSEQRIELAQELAQNIADRYQVATQIAIHQPSKIGDERNYHVHILTTTRKIDNDLNLTDKSDIELSNKKCISLGIKTTDEQIKSIRELIAVKTNEHLKQLEIKEQINHLSYKEQGINKIPTKHMGKSCTHLEKKGVNTEIGNYNRIAMQFNELRIALKSIYDISYGGNLHQNVKNALEELKPTLNKNLSATERAKNYLHSLSENKFDKAYTEKNKVKNSKDKLLSDILSKHSYDKIIDRHKKEKEFKLQQEQTQKHEYQKTLNRTHKGFGFGR